MLSNLLARKNSNNCNAKNPSTISIFSTACKKLKNSRLCKFAMWNARKELSGIADYIKTDKETAAVLCVFLARLFNNNSKITTAGNASKFAGFKNSAGFYTYTHCFKQLIDIGILIQDKNPDTFFVYKISQRFIDAIIDNKEFKYTEESEDKDFNVLDYLESVADDYDEEDSDCDDSDGEESDYDKPLERQEDEKKDSNFISWSDIEEKELWYPEKTAMQFAMLRNSLDEKKTECYKASS